MPPTYVSNNELEELQVEKKLSNVFETDRIEFVFKEYVICAVDKDGVYVVPTGA